MWQPLLTFYLLILQADPQLLFVKPQAQLSYSLPETTAQLEASWGNGLATPVEKLIAPKSGRHLLALFTKTPLGIRSDANWYLVQVDDQLPAIQLTLSKEPVTGPHGKSWVAKNTQLQLYAEDSQSGLKTLHIVHNGQTQVLTDSKAIISLANSGHQTVEAFAIDNVGHESEKTITSLHVDDLPPQGKLVYQGNHVLFQSQNIIGPKTMIQIEAKDQESGLASIAPEINGKKVSAAKLKSNWQEGTFALSAALADKVGNTVTLTSTSVRVDGTPPEISWNSNQAPLQGKNGKDYYSFPLTLNFTSMDKVFGASKIEYFHPTLGWLEPKGSFSLAYPIAKVRSKDLLGNEKVQTFTWPSDATSPLIQLRYPNGEAIEANSTVRLSVGDELIPLVTDNESGVSSATFHFADGPVKPMPDTFRFNKVEQFFLTIEAKDHFGNHVKNQWFLQIKRKKS